MVSCPEEFLIHAGVKEYIVNSIRVTSLRIVCVVVAAVFLPADAARIAHLPMNEGFYLTYISSWNNRTGYYIDNDYVQPDTSKAQLTLGGLGLGVRFAVVDEWLRAGFRGSYTRGHNDRYLYENAPISQGGGMSLEDIIILNEFNNVMLTSGLQLVLPNKDTPLHPFWTIGVDGYMMDIRERGRGADNSSIARQRVSLEGGLHRRNLGVAFHIEAGFDFSLAQQWGLAVSWLHRYWQPVSYTYTEQLPLEGISYYEFFRTHALRVTVVWRRGLPQR